MQRGLTKLSRIRGMSPSVFSRSLLTTNLSPVPSTHKNDTIFALSSGAEGISGVAIIRISGPNAKHCLQSLIKPTATFPSPRMASVRHLISSTTKEVLDQAMVLWFPGPRSFTGEDVCELHVHGSRAVIRGVFTALTELNPNCISDQDTDGASAYLPHVATPHRVRLAQRGEFTKRAFENGRLDLTEAEGLGDLLVADTSAQRKQALRQMEGHMRRTYEGWRDELKSCLAHCEAVIDFGDDDRENDIDDSDMWLLSPRVKSLCAELESLLSDKHRGEIIRDGVRVALIGPPNAGKSSLLNLLAKRPAAIVSPVAGTTRDVVEVRLDFDGISCIVSDTAGIKIKSEYHKRSESGAGSHEGHTAVSGGLNTYGEEEIFWSPDAIEYEGMKRARDVYESAHVKILICDASDSCSVNSTFSLLDTLHKQNSSPNMRDNNANITSPEKLLPFISKPAQDADGKTDKFAHTFVIFNKIDLLTSSEQAAILSKVKINCEELPSSAVSVLSCSKGTGLQEIENALSATIKNLISNDQSGEGGEREGELITRTRHRMHVQQCVQHLQTFLEEDMLPDTAAEELRLAMAELGKLTGRVEVEDLLDVIFRDFCIGK